MIKCLFVDIASISTNTPKSKFNQSKIEALADSILTCDGLLRPLLLQQVAGDRYTVIEGHLEYYAAVRAKEKDLHKAEMVNAFIIPPQFQQSAIEQLKLLSTAQSRDVDRQIDVQVETTNLELENSDRLAAAIQLQIQPLQQQLINVIAEVAAHKQILNSLSPPAQIVTAIEPTVDDKKAHKPSDEKVISAPQPQHKTKTVKPPSANAKKSRSTKTELKPALLPEKDLTSQVDITPKKLSAKTTEKPKAERSKDPAPQPADPSKKSSSRSNAAKPKADPFAALDADRLVTTLNLINELSLNDLTLRMSRSGIGKSAAKIAAGIVAEREARVDRQFATWADVLAAKIDGLTAKSALNIIEKLK